MSKRYRHFFNQITDWDNLLLAWRNARKGKRGYPPAATFEMNAAENLLYIQRELVQRTYLPGPYTSFLIHEPKRRLISAAPFRDRIVHHALCNVIEPIFERRFIHDSYANREDKGTHAAIDRCQFFSQRYLYVLQCDVQQFFPAIDHVILRNTIQHVIVDPDALWLIDTILESGRDVLTDAYSMVIFQDDDLFAYSRPRGLPIGNLTSQFWGNVYLNQLDHFVKRQLKCKAYLRFVDDFMLFADDKKTLWEWRTEIINFLAGLRLTLHEERTHPQPVSEGIPFLGFVVYPTYRRLKRRKGINYRRALRQLIDLYHRRAIEREAIDASLQGWINHVRYGQTFGLRRALVGELTIEPARRNISIKDE